MAHTITIDIGNSRTKVDLWNRDGFESRISAGELDFDRIYSFIENYQVKALIVSSVRKGAEEVVRKLKEAAKLPVVNFNVEEIRKYYDIHDYQGSVGPDRIAAIIGAGDYAEGRKLVVDLGTAITLDLGGPGGEFYGGNISAGMKTRLRALAENASRLPDVKISDEGVSFGSDTVSALQAGVRNGVIGEILYTIELAKKEYDIKALFLTGGDAESISEGIRTDLYKKTDLMLVSRGLNRHLRNHYLRDDF